MRQRKRTLKRSVDPVALKREDIRTAIRAVHVLQDQYGKWEVRRRAGATQVSRRFDRKNKALEFAKRICAVRRSALVVHGRPGKQGRKAVTYPTPGAALGRGVRGR